MKLITAIPWFVWLLLGYVILRGVRALQSQVMPVKKLVIVPLIFLYIGLTGMINQSIPLGCTALWFALFAISGFVTWLRTQSLKIVCDRQKWLIELPGTWATLVLLLSIFVSKFTFGFLSATHPEFKNLLLFNLLSLSISGVVCGISIGRLIALLQKFFNSAHVDLQKPD
jgi:hypothetical protein